MRNCHKESLKGFTLVELSIVLVILGLLVGGVLTGQSLIRASELRAITTEATGFTTAMSAFRDKYFALPGDMTNASSFWSGVGNGNGDGNITNHGTAANNEISLFWIHLTQAGLVQGNFTNIGGTTMTVITNAPRSKIGAMWNVIGLGSVTPAGAASTTNVTAPAASTFYDGTYGNAFVIGNGTSAILPTGFIKSEEAWNIDTKMDDGKPSTGTVKTLESQGSATAGAGCGNLASANTTLVAAIYDLANTSGSACSLVINSAY